MATIPEMLATAVQHHQVGQLHAAELIYRQVLATTPHQPDALHLLGVLAHQVGKHDIAVQLIGQAISLHGNEPIFHNNLGEVYRALRRMSDAVACYRRAVELNPDYVEAQSNLGSAYQVQGKPDEAVACCRRALERNPNFVGAYTNLGNALKDLGKLDEAVACYRQVVALQYRQPAAEGHPQDTGSKKTAGAALGQLAAILRNRLPESELQAIRQLLSEPDLGDEIGAALQFGLGSVFDARGQYDAAAERFREANAACLAFLMQQNRDYHPVEYGAFVSDMAATFAPQFFARTSGFGLQTEQPVFIVGLPRSGTTLVEQILASHSQVFGAGELNYVGETFQSLPEVMNRNGTSFECLRDLDCQATRHLAQRHLDRLRALNERALRIVDKMPENYHYLGLVETMFPQSRIIHCRRDLRDVALSCWTTHFVDAPWACDLEKIVSHFEEYSRMMAHWREVLPSPPLDVDYEELVEDTEGVARRIVQWCGLEWEPRCLRFYETQRPVRTASAAQVRQPIYRSSLGRWKNYEESLGEVFSKMKHLDEMRKSLKMHPLHETDQLQPHYTLCQGANTKSAPQQISTKPTI